MDQELKSLLSEDIESMKIEMEELTISINREANKKAKILYEKAMVIFKINK